MIEDALRRELAAAHVGGARPTVPVFDAGTGPRPGIDLTSNTVLSEVLDEGLELNSRK
ncbi:antitoxin [Mycobacterium tuberculosis UT0084]|nr:antitoxin [Mycobacterium tuberculosis UT0084]KBL46541.1 antitoxin [Mycobacterium tuberculosis UT0088]KBL93109.1 antitoxin [Mycobacterium tuberculosis UT0105]KCG45703.1 antitoxin [Mycobacterium tuberculosis KT-0063]CNY37815.1 antitoxin [Mycobacterium tuberculosis]